MATLPARAAIQLQPGLWEMNQSGTENGEATVPRLGTYCMSPEDGKNPIKAFTAMKGPGVDKCSTLQVQRNGNKVSVAMTCSGAKHASIDAHFAFTFRDLRHYSGRIKTAIVYAGGKIKSDQTLDAHWIRANCGRQ